MAVFGDGVSQERYVAAADDDNTIISWTKYAVFPVWQKTVITTSD